ncbi:MAG: pyridoxamine 5'-phosphate oxidase family protein [Anaerolineae bacterium]|nr:pyridoxamine 5'-phosphate oxidase family protein [Anaerolineae bacterium]
MLTDAIREILQQPLVARVSTIGPDGYPHTVPVWYILDGDDLVFSSAEDTRKVKNIRANPKGAIAIGGDPQDEIGEAYTPGYLFQGDFTLAPDPGSAWIRRITLHYYRQDAERADRDVTAWGELYVVRFTIRKVIKVM